MCVRAVQMKGVELDLFQFDFDQTWAVVFLNGDGTIYGRYGTRAGERDTAAARVTIEGLARTMEGVLEVHEAFPELRSTLAAKKGPKPPAPVPERLGPLQDSRFRQALPRGCMHCHKVWEGIRAETRPRGKPVPDEWLWLYPLPEDIGLELDTKERATVTKVLPGTSGEAAGFLVGDRILQAAGQPILSPADLQWVLYRAPAEGEIPFEVGRGDGEATFALPLAKGWRRKGTFDWRSSSWPIRPGLRLDPASEAERTRAGGPCVGLKVRTMAPNRQAAKAGIKVGDIFVSVDGKTDAMRPEDFTAYLYQEKRGGQKVRIVLLRGGRREEVDLEVP